MQIKYDATAPFIAGPNPASDLSITIISTPESVGSTQTNTAVKDVIYDTVTIPTITNPNFLVVTSDPDASLVNLTPSVCSLVDNSVSRLTDGICKIRIDTKSTGSRKIERSMNVISDGPTVYGNVIGGVSGSLIKHLTDRADALCAAYSPESFDAHSAIQRFYATKVPNSWTAGIDYTILNENNWMYAGVSGWEPFTQQELLDTFSGWLNNHYQVLAGGGNHGIPCSASSLAAGYCGDVGADYHLRAWDTVAKPANRNPIKVLPDNWRSYLPSLGLSSSPTYNVRVPVWARLQNTWSPTFDDYQWIMPLDWCLVSGFCQLPIASQRARFCVNGGHPAYSGGYPYGAVLHGGDSFSPVFTKINTTPVLLGFISTGGGAFAGVLTKGMLDTLMNSMATKRGDPLAGTYSCQEVDLSIMFNDYS